MKPEQRAAIEHLAAIWSDYLAGDTPFDPSLALFSRRVEGKVVTFTVADLRALQALAQESALSSQ